MLTALWSGLGSKVADRWALLLTSPALGFWMGGLLAWIHAHGGITGRQSGWKSLGRAWDLSIGSLPAAAQALTAVLAVLLVAGSARLAEELTFGVLRLLEGYWPRPTAPLRIMMLNARGRAGERRAERWRDLARRRTELTAAEFAEYTALNAARALVPPAPRDRMPTRLGDILKAAESRPRHRYGLDAAVCWPHLWLSLPEQARAEIATSRARLDEAARLWLWGLLFLLWTTFTWWAVAVAVLGMFGGYRLALSGAVDYGRLVQAGFDLYRRNLYDGLGWTFPEDPSQEYVTGQRMTTYLERGPLPGGPV
ncbi:hypothetical protein [Streptomyces sp. NPDC018833]|uniref:hypothetical protein n=1 Tax=Streptomyces sp. NPDC018833 TaxID=3365053 RepID=UPI0037B5B120